MRAANGPNPGGVLVAGSINTDLVAQVRTAPRAGETVTGHGFAIFGGGKGANQAVAAARSGATTAILGAVGSDDFGRQRLADLEHEGIDVTNVARVEEKVSGVALILVEEGGQNRIAYVPGATRSVTAEQAIRAVERVRPTVVLATLELPIDVLGALFEAARRTGATIVLNATPEPGSGRGLISGADVLIVNETEARDLVGPAGQGDWTATVGTLAELGAPSVVLTLGADGAVVGGSGGVQTIAAPAVEVLDTTGAGDALCGAFAAMLAGGADVSDAAGAGVIAGSLAVTKAGAQPSMPSRHEIERFAQE